MKMRSISVGCIVIVAVFFSANIYAASSGAQACEPSASGTPYLYPIKSDTNAFDAARMAAKFAKKDPNNAARIVAVSAVQISADTNDLALIMSSVMNALNLRELDQMTKFMADVETFHCSSVSLVLLQQNLGAFRSLNPGNPDNVHNPANPTGPADMDDPNTTIPGHQVSPN